MTREDIVRDALTGWLTVEFVFRPLKNDLISRMIYQGKIMYLLQQILPEEKGISLVGIYQSKKNGAGIMRNRSGGF